MTNRSIPEDGELYDVFFRSHPVAMWIFDVETLGILDVNDAAIARYGYERETFARLTIRDIRPPEDVAAMERVVTAPHGGPTDVGEWRHLSAAGTVIHTRIVSQDIEFRGRPARLAVLEDVTAERSAHDQLRLLSAALYSAANAIVITDTQGTIEWVNPAFTAMTGYDSSEAIGRNPRELVRSGHHDPAFYRHLWETITRGEVWRGQVLNRRKDGTVYPEEQTITPVRDADGAVTHFVAIKEDVSERLRTETTLRDSEVRHRKLFENMPVGLYRSTLEGRFLDANETMVRILGYPSREALLATPVIDLYADGAGRHEFIELADGGGSMGAAELQLRRLDGELIWARVNVGVERDAAGRAVALEGSLEDISDRRRAEDALRYQAQLLDAVGEAVIATDLEGRIRFWSPQAEAMFGWSQQQVLGRDLIELAVPSTGVGRAREVLEFVRGGKGWSGESECSRHDGSTLPVHTTKSPIYDEVGRMIGIVGVSRDLTRQRSLENQLLQAQKMEAIGQLTGGVAHDFNNVLTSIRGHIQLLMESLPPGPQWDDADAVRRSAERATLLIQQLLAFSRQQVLRPQVLDVRSTLTGVENLVRPLIGADIEFSIAMAEDGIRVEADSIQIEQVLVNLVVNARDAMPTGGSLRIAVRRFELDEEFARQFPYRVDPGPYVLIEVADTGVGMDEATCKRIFEPFFTTKEPGKGTGLGLSTAYGVIKQSGGYIWVQSEPGLGTTFRVCLPRTDAPVSAHKGGRSEWIAPLPLSSKDNGRVILLVEDEESVRALARRVLVRAGFRVVVASASDEALRAMAEPVDGSIDLVITDVVMPGISGIELVHRMHELHPGIPAIFMSGYTADEVARRGMVDGRHHFLPKPFTPAELIYAVGRALR